MSEASKRVTSGLLARAVVRTAVALGADGPKLLRDAEVAQPVMEDASVRLTGAEMDRIWAAAMAATGNPGLGYLVGRAVDPTELGLATTLIASTDNLVNAMELAVRYSPLIGRQAYQMRRDGREIRLAMDVSNQPMIASHEPVVLHLLAGTALRDVTAESTADALGVSPRTLYRRLKADGDSYQAILDRVRHHRCLAQLEEGHVAPTELSARLGFAEASSFYRAFQRWTGRSFAAFREERERAAQ